MENNTTMYDENNNAIEVPGGFKVKNPKEDNTIIYDYLKDKTPAVQDGIVIEDDIGNQFVWIPVGTEENAIKDNNGETTEIKLARRNFDKDGIEKNTTEDGSSISGYREEKTGSYGVTLAKNIDEFKTSVNDNHGYYIARYEAGNNGGKVTSKQGAVWSNISQSSAASAARVMYTSGEYESDLINSYAWDTAIVFMQKYSENNKYSIQVSKNSSVSITGERETEDITDKVCNIYDIASNCYEWSTEVHINGSDGRCVVRGGLSVGKYGCAIGRNFYTTGALSNCSLRVILYMNNTKI